MEIVQDLSNKVPFITNVIHYCLRLCIRSEIKRSFIVNFDFIWRKTRRNQKYIAIIFGFHLPLGRLRIKKVKKRGQGIQNLIAFVLQNWVLIKSVRYYLLSLTRIYARGQGHSELKNIFRYIFLSNIKQKLHYIILLFSCQKSKFCRNAWYFVSFWQIHLEFWYY